MFPSWLKSCYETTLGKDTLHFKKGGKQTQNMLAIMDLKTCFFANRPLLMLLDSLVNFDLAVYTHF